MKTNSRASHNSVCGCSPRVYPASILLAAFLVCCSMLSVRAAEPEKATSWDKPPMIGMYVHQHWSYNHPYAARTWTLDDWSGYLDGLKKIGFNTVLIWPVLETMPEPLTPSDQENIDKIAQVIELAHTQLEMRVLIALCPNVIAKNEEAVKYSFKERPFFYCDQRINPADAEEMGRMIAWRRQLFELLKAVDGVLIIDSDPGGYPGSNNLEFVSLLNAHRTMFSKLNPNIELYYWVHAGWEAYCRFYATAEFAMGEAPEIEEAIKFLAKVNPEPWGLASGRGPHVADALGMPDRVLSYQYGAIEGEPSFPMTNFGTPFAYEAGKNKGVRGTMGNSQTHCVQLPNAFLFARGANDQPLPERADYVAYAERLLPGNGEAIVGAWEVLNGTDAGAMRAVLANLDPLLKTDLKTGDLGGLLFGDPRRFINDLVMMLTMHATLEDFHAAAMAGAPAKESGEKLAAYVDAAAVWQQTHGYRNNWSWPRMEEALLKVDPDTYTALFAQRSYKGEGATPFEQVQAGFKQVETYTPRMLEAMQDTARKLQAQ